MFQCLKHGWSDAKDPCPACHAPITGAGVDAVDGRIYRHIRSLCDRHCDLIGEMKVMLKSLEFAGAEGEMGHIAQCGSCTASEYAGHSKDCKLDALLKKVGAS